MSDWPDGYVTVNNFRLHYTRTGGDKPPLLLLHGITDQGLCWAEFARSLAADYDVIMADARGHGLSDGDGIELSLDALVDDIAGLIRALDIAPVHVIGHSMGGLTATWLAAYYPELVRSVVLEDPALTIYDRPLEDRLEWAANSRKGAEAARLKSRDEHIATLRQQNPHWSASEVENWADARPNVRADTGSLMASTPKRPWRIVVAYVLCPALLLCPGPAKGITGPDTVDEIISLVPSIQVERFPGAGHCIRRDQPAQYERVVREFLARA